MNLLHALELDLGTYVAAMALFAGIVCYRANPLRAVNRFMTGMLLTISVWQVAVTLARVTRHPEIWGPICLPLGFGILVLLFLMHDACVDPHARLRTRLFRSRLMWLAAAILTVGMSLAFTETIAPHSLPYWTRLFSVAALIAVLYQLRKQRRKARGVNPYELLLFQVTAIEATLVFAVYQLNRTPISSRLNTVLTFIYVSIVIGLLFSERVFDAGDTAKLALGYVIRFSLHVAIVFGVASLYLTLTPLGDDRLWPLAIVVAIIVYPTDLLCAYVARKVVHSSKVPADVQARDAAIDILGSAASEHLLLNQIQELAAGYLGGLEVKLTTITATARDKPTPDVRWQLAGKVHRGSLSPDTAVREFRGDELDRVLQWFAETRTGAVLKYSGRQVTTIMFVGERDQGSTPITGRELDLLLELNTIASIGVERLRAVEDGFRAQTLAMVGQMAADFSQASRGQIAAIQSLVEAVKEGRENELSREFRERVYDQTVSLAASHNLTLELTRLGPGKLRITHIPLDTFVCSLADTFRQMTGATELRIIVEPIDEALVVAADDRLLRQVLLNVFRTCLPPASSTTIPRVLEVRAHGEDQFANLEISHGTRDTARDEYMQSQGTHDEKRPGALQLSLAFSTQAMRALGGNITYTAATPLNASRIRVNIPRANAGGGTSAGSIAAAVP